MGDIMKWRRRLMTIAFVVIASPAFLSKPSEAHDHSHAIEQVKRSLVVPKIPAVTLVRDDGANVDFSEELRDPRPVYLNFIYTSCTTVCPVMSQIFSTLQDNLATDRINVRMISISVDPEYDTPSRLTAYANRFGAGTQWHFYTGSTDMSLTIQKAFGVFIRDKMNHPIASFYRGAPDLPWVRIDGFASPEQLEAEYRSVNGG
jgi:protein SCO1